ncbi:flagellar M-ring protein FliF [Massilia sp. G4R7]|uniref:Flagellar M-ring protein n=1 Tax=Massilia phyllostachyos TaxID=2898585 RepID=A0ABS8Q2C9_9BURK|nr:flagellar basal-body MS-ring/collar protein FliF [Massilia phyllostachyos]MCD2515673.1 flagellar M-ring protein FliF [Massilia phyllostachyos]
MAAVADDLIDTPAPEQTGPQGFFQTTMGKRVALGGGIALVVAIMAALWMWSQAPEYRVLFSNYSDRDGGAITASLDQMGVKYKFSEGGTAILVPSEQIPDLRLKLAAQGLPKGGNVGFELLENQKLGTSQFVEQVNYQRSLEGELARSIQSLGPVSSARVHLAMPKPSVFVREQQKPTASVVLNLQAGRALDPGQVSAIVHLVASSVPELTIGNVTVVDQTGNLLSDTSTKGPGKQLDPTQLKYVDQVQANIIKQVESIIAPLVGKENVRAEATAEIDFAQVDTAAEMYKPNSPPEPQAIRSQQTSESTQPGAGASGIPGALSNQPPGVATAPIDGQAPPAAAAPAAGPTRKDATTNYEVDKTIRYEQRQMGGIKRLTVGVVVNYRRSVDPNTGKVTVKPLTTAEVAQINELVKQAMGYSQQRGDTLNVTNAPFNGVDKPDDTPQDPDWWRDPANLPLAKEIGKYLLLFAVLAFLYYRILLPLMRPAIKKFDEVTALPPEPEPEEEEEAEEDALPDEEELEEQEVERRAQGYRANLKMAQELAKQDPRIVANVVKAWLGSNE